MCIQPVSARPHRAEGGRGRASSGMLTTVLGTLGVSIRPWHASKIGGCDRLDRDAVR